jgi:hypothetical protein
MRDFLRFLLERLGFSNGVIAKGNYVIPDLEEIKQRSATKKDAK